MKIGDKIRVKQDWCTVKKDEIYTVKHLNNINRLSGNGHVNVHRLKRKGGNFDDGYNIPVNLVEMVLNYEIF